jgi:hypothetical protein
MPATSHTLALATIGFSNPTVTSKLNISVDKYKNAYQLLSAESYKTVTDYISADGGEKIQNKGLEGKLVSADNSQHGDSIRER